jgi:NAD(P)-dependent dehydrogenase (short-subunit alcohol dehydrogenase family)
MAGRLQGKVAIITGAGSVGAGWGNGRAAAVLFAQEGALVFGVDRNLASMEETAERIREPGGRFATAECDVTDAASVARAVEACRREFGRIDVWSTTSAARRRAARWNWRRRSGTSRSPSISRASS